MERKSIVSIKYYYAWLIYICLLLTGYSVCHRGKKKKDKPIGLFTEDTDVHCTPFFHADYSDPTIHYAILLLVAKHF